MMLIVLAATALLSSDADIERAVAAAPPQVRAFIERRRACNHWAGEEPYDEDRARQIRSAVRKLRCHAIERDGERLRRSLVSKPDLLALFDQTADWY